MIKSMTGYGNGSSSHDALVVEVEAKSINHRYFDISIHLPRELTCLEHGIRKLVQKRFFRGHFDVWVKVEWLNKNQIRPRLNLQLAKEHLNALRRLQHELQLPGDISVEFLESNPHLFIRPEEAIRHDAVSLQLNQALTQALDALAKMRVEEGRAVYEDINQIAAQIKKNLTQIKQRFPQLVGDYRDRLAQRVNKLASQLNISIGEERLAQEVVIYAERSDISEELVRLSSHLNQLLGFLEADGAMGKKLDFLVQEMVNTIGSKVSDVTVSEQVVEIRSCLEKIREQVQNVE
jgi:uncharacterized protein (TIGR00255 family)